MLGISREELGRQLSVTGKFISDIEYGDKGVSLKTLYRLKQILGVSADYILEGEDEDISADEKKRKLNENIIGSLRRMFGKTAELYGEDREVVCRERGEKGVSVVWMRQKWIRCSASCADYRS